MRRFFLVLAACALSIGGGWLNELQAEVRTAAVFGSGMVLQQESPLPVWGWADPGEEVTVSFREQTKSTKADGEGNWSVKLDPVKLGKPGVLTVKGKNTLTFDDVLVGEVWVCSGQSNMGWTVDRSVDPDLEKAAANYPRIRLFQVPLTTATEPQQDVDASWAPCTPETVGNFSAVAYYFGRQLHQVLQVPVGIVQTAWGGTRAEAWTSPEMMTKTKELAPILETWEKRVATPENQAAGEAHQAALKQWDEKAKAARKAGTRVPAPPAAAETSRWSRHHPSNLYNAMVAPLTPFAIRGAIWYQGESNAGRAYQYRTLMPALIQSWRDAWGQGDFPFYQVQLANFKEIKTEPGESDWAELREAQHMARKALPNVDAACITDLGAAKDIHPKDKQNVAKRLARLALYDVYDRTDIIRQGPTYESVRLEGNKAIVKFDTHGAPLETWYKEPLQGFTAAGEDRQWVNANAKITGPDTVEVTLPGQKSITAVRYNWADNPQGNLYNAAMLPAYPFRTDDWEGITVNNVNP